MTLTEMNLRYNGWRVRTSQDHERERIGWLNEKPPANAPHLTQTVRVRVLRPFFNGGIRQELGAETTLSAADAASLAAIGRCEII